MALTEPISTWPGGGKVELDYNVSNERVRAVICTNPTGTGLRWACKVWDPALRNPDGSFPPGSHFGAPAPFTFEVSPQATPAEFLVNGALRVKIVTDAEGFQNLVCRNSNTGLYEGVPYADQLLPVG